MARAIPIAALKALTGRAVDKTGLLPRPFTDAMSDPAEAVGRLYDRHGAGLYRYALMILADPSAAADAIQQVFVSILTRGVAIQDETRYLRRAVRNECFTILRRRSRFDDAPLLEAAGEPVDPTERLALEQAIRTLPAEQREVLHLKAFEGLTFQEIADATGESINTVASRYRYAIEKLRAQLGGE